MPSVPLWKLRRLAPRAKRIIERRKNDSPVFTAYEATVVAAVDEYVAAYDQAAGTRANWRREMQEGRDAIQVLSVCVRSWIPLVSRDVPGFSGNDLRASSVPDDVIGGAEHLLGATAAHEAATGTTLAYREALAADVTAKLDAARKERSEAEGADQGYQQTLADVRAKGDVLATELRSLRRTLEALVGRSDKDYQKLRIQRAARRDEDDDPNAPPPDEDGGLDDDLPDA
ncbi:hypothetical protein [Haliangium sp.]|uniref:hypothetical protein n=1 Tax=Haliangium sp. TaxID=2663208 RepID=UPI003D0F7886